jgi:negative regulator of flagellin synthesis FlgM
MKIGQLETKAATPAVNERKPGPAATPAPAAGGGVEPSAQVALSPTVSQLAAGGQEGVFDAEKVQRISEAIRDGKFSVNADAIADKLIANAQELLGAVGKR